MSEWLHLESLLRAHPSLLQLADGQQTKLNHDACPAGRDVKQRLVVKRDGETFIAWCHHCQQKGVYGGNPETANHTRRRRQQLNRVQPTIELPKGLTYDPHEFHPLANVWLNKYSITYGERERYGIAWSEYYGRVLLPVYMNEGLVAYQLRRILPDDDGPKYLTTRKQGVSKPLWQGGQWVSGGAMVLTEDILSAIKVSRVANATALLGTHTPQENLAYILRNKPDVVLLWLDDDNPDVRDKQRKAYRRIRAFVPCHIVHSHGKDPKEHTVEEIEEVISAFIPRS